MIDPKLLRGSLDTIILKLLDEHDEMYGYQITQLVKELTAGEMKLTEGALYPALHRLCLLYTSPSPRDATLSRMPSSA